MNESLFEWIIWNVQTVRILKPNREVHVYADVK